LLGHFFKVSEYGTVLQAYPELVESWFDHGSGHGGQSRVLRVRDQAHNLITRTWQPSADQDISNIQKSTGP
jgi:hypothetical protein